MWCLLRNNWGFISRRFFCQCLDLFQMSLYIFSVVSFCWSAAPSIHRHLIFLIVRRRAFYINGRCNIVELCLDIFVSSWVCDNEIWCCFHQFLQIWRALEPRETYSPIYRKAAGCFISVVCDRYYLFIKIPAVSAFGSWFTSFPQPAAMNSRTKNSMEKTGLMFTFSPSLFFSVTTEVRIV